MVGGTFKKEISMMLVSAILMWLDWAKCAFGDSIEWPTTGKGMQITCTRLGMMKISR